jgi:hypothetical protein
MVMAALIDLEQLVEDQLSVVAGQVNAQHAAAVGVIASALEHGTWQGAGISTPEQWVRLRMGVSTGRSRTLVRVARRAAEFPATIAEFAAGGLSLEQVETVVTRAPAWTDQRMAGFAGALTVQQLQRVLRDEFFDGPATPPSAGEPAAASDSPEPVTPEPVTAPVASDVFRFGWNELGRFTGFFDLGPEFGKVAEALFDKIGSDLFDAHSTPPASSDVLLETIARAATNPTSGTLLESWGNGSRVGDSLGRFRAFLHLELSDDATHLLAEFTDATPLPDAIRDYLTCDGELTPVWMRDHTPVGYGRTQRIVPTKLRKIVKRRDRGCRVPGCGAHHIEVHHIIHWNDGGVTETWNLILLCARHHHLLHLGQLQIRGNADRPETLEFLDAHHNPIRGPNPVKPTQPPEPVAPYDAPTGGRLDLRYFSGWVHPDVAAYRQQRAAEHIERQQELERRYPPRDFFAEYGRAW